MEVVAVLLNKIKLLLTLGIALGIVLLLSIIIDFFYSEDKLDQVLEGVMKNLAIPDYSIEQKIPGGGLVDVSALWRVSLNHPILDSCFSKRHLEESDDSDLAYFVSTIREKMHLREPIEEYKLLRGNMRIEEGELCADQYCSIYFLCAEGNKTIYVAIFKN